MDDIRREPRHKVKIQGQYRTGHGKPRDIVVADLSTMGCKFTDPFSNLVAGAFLTIRIGNIGPLNAEVSWVDASTVGLKFETAIQSYILEHMCATIDGWQSP